MTFSDFIHIMYKYMGQSMTKENYLTYFLDLIVRPARTKEEKEADDRDEFNPASRYKGSIAGKIFNGSRHISKKDANRIHQLFDAKKLIGEIKRLSDGQKEQLIADLESYKFCCTKGYLPEYCANIFLALIRAFCDGHDHITPDMIRADILSKHESFYLIEAQQKCPLCHASLLQTMPHSDKILKNFSVISIFPRNLNKTLKIEFEAIKRAPINIDAPDNQIALCRTCGEQYQLCPTPEVYERLCHIKSTFLKNAALDKETTPLELQDQLKKILDHLYLLQNVKQYIWLQHDAKTINQKIAKENQILRDQVQDHVVRYYRYIEHLFSDMDNENRMSSEEIATSVKLLYIKLAKTGLSQQEIYSRLSSLILQKLELDPRYFLSAQIVVSFFIQNCEVFSDASPQQSHPIPKEHSL